MVATDPVSTDSVELSSETADDGTRHTDSGGDPYLTTLTDDATDIAAYKMGKGGTDGDGARLVFPGFAGIAVGDTITINLLSIHQIDDGCDLLAYTDSNTVTVTDRINKDAPLSTGDNVYTLTSGFITALNDIGSDNFAVRYVTRALEAGDVAITEVDSNLTVAGAPVILKAPESVHLRR